MISKSVGSDENENKSRKLDIKKCILLPPPPPKKKKKEKKEKASRCILAWLINEQFFEESCQTFYLRN